MNSLQLHTIIIALVTSCACALPGIFLMLRGVALMSDAISHAILPGIVTFFLLVGNLESPWLIIGATVSGMLTILITEWIITTQRLKKDAALGLVFPVFFSIGVLLITNYARSTHLDTDMVMLGELAFAPFERLIVQSYDLGPCALWTMGTIALLNALLIALFYKELTISLFDPLLAQLLGYSTTVVYYLLMLATSITTVAAFNIVGSIVVVSLTITPAGTAYLVTNKLVDLLTTTLQVAIVGTLIGYYGAHMVDVSIAGSIATAHGIIFLTTFCCISAKGLCSQLFFQLNNERELTQKIVDEHIRQKCCTDLATISRHLGWSPSYTKKYIDHRSFDHSY